VLFSALNAKSGERDHKVPLFLSLVLPGGGQVYNGNYVKAGFYIALEGVFVYGAIKQHQRMEDAEKKLEFFRDMGLPEEIDKYEFFVQTYKNDRNNFIWMSIASVILSAGDAYVDSRFKSFKRDVFKRDDEILVEGSINRLSLIYKW